MPNQFEYSKTFFDRWYRPEYTTVIVAGDVTPEEVLPLVEKYWGPWKAGSYKVDVPVEPPPAGPVVAHVPWTAPTLPWVSVAFRLPAFTETSREWAALDVLSDLDLRAHLGALQEPGGGRAEGRPDGRLLPAEPRPLPGHGLRPRQEDRGHALRARPDPAGLRGNPRRADGTAAGEGREGQRALLAAALARQHRVDRGLARALRALSPLVRHDQRALPHLRRGHAGRHPGGRPPLLRGRRAGADDALEGPAAGRRSRRSPRSRRSRSRRPCPCRPAPQAPAPLPAAGCERPRA